MISTFRACATSSVLTRAKKIEKFLTLKTNFASQILKAQLTNVSFQYIDFFAKNLPNFVSLPWQLDNPYYHRVEVKLCRSTSLTSKCLAGLSCAILIFLSCLTFEGNKRSFFFLSDQSQVQNLGTKACANPIMVKSPW